MYIKRKYMSTILSEASRGAGTQIVTVRPAGCGFDPTRGDEIFT